MTHLTPRMHQRPDDPAYQLLDSAPVTVQKVHRRGCFICEDREFARMGLPLCNLCCVCAAAGTTGHISADESDCDDCGHEICEACVALPPETNICTCDTPCCEADVGIGIITCGGQHCPTHGEEARQAFKRVEEAMKRIEEERGAQPSGPGDVLRPDGGLPTEEVPGTTPQT